MKESKSRLSTRRENTAIQQAVGSFLIGQGRAGWTVFEAEGNQEFYSRPVEGKF